MWYKAGTANLTNNSAIVTGTGTYWATQVKIGDIFTVNCSDFYEVESIDSNTQITLGKPYSGATDAASSYNVIRNFTYTTNATIATDLLALLDSWKVREDELQAWMAGTVNGGVGNDGLYPLTDQLGNTYQVACPAHIEWLAGNSMDWATTAEDVVVDAANFPGEYSSKHHAIKSDTSRAAAVVAQTAAETAETNTETARDKAQDWAEEVEDTEVETGQYSALHHATKAAASKTAAETAEINAEAAEAGVAADAATATTKAAEATASATAAGISETNAGTSETTASTAAGNAGTAQTASETAQTATELAETNATAANNSAQTAKTAAETAETNAGIAETNAETAETSAVASASAASTSETNSSTSETNSSASETNAAASASAASTSETNAAASEAKAEDWAEETEDVEVETGKYSAKHWSAKAEETLIDKLNISDFTGADILSRLLTVDGDGSELDADLLGGLTSADFLTIAAHVTPGHAPSDAQKNSDITIAEIEAKLIGTIETHDHGPTGSFVYSDITTSSSVSAKDCASVDTTGGEITLTLPPSPDDGDQIIVQDRNGSFDVNNCILNNNGKKIQRALDTLILDVKDINILLIFNTNQDSWMVNFYAGAIIPTHIVDFDDVLVTSPATGDVLSWNGTDWVNSKGTEGAKGGGTNNVFYENDTNITDDYTITSGKNAMSAGPITIDTGVTVTIPTGSTWTVI